MQAKKGTRASPKTGRAPRIPARLLTNHYVYIIAFAVLTAVLFREFLFSGSMLSSSDQIAGIDSRVVLKDALIRDRQFPTWMPSRLGGMPSIDAMFGDAMYVPSLLFYIFLPVHRALGMISVLHVFLAGLMFYLMMARGFGAHPGIAFVGAAFYMLNPEFVSHVYPGHAGKMMVIAWLPFVVWRLKRLIDLPSLLNASLYALGISICLFTSHTQMTYFMLWGLFLYWCVSMALEWKTGRMSRRFVLSAVYFWAAVLVGVAMAAMQFLPSFLFIREAFSVRGVERGFDYAASWSLHWPEFFSLWVPEFGNFLENYWSENPFKLNTEYAGAMTCLFAGFAVAFRPKNVWRIFWASVAVLAVLYSMGAHTPVFHIAYYLIPGVKKFRACSMIMFWFSFSASLLCGFFLTDVFTGAFSGTSPVLRKKWDRAFMAVLGGFTLLAALFSVKGFVSSIMQGVLADPRKSRIFDMNFDENFVPMLWLWWGMATVSVSILWAHMHQKVGRVLFILVVLAIGLIDAFRLDARFIQVVNPRRYIVSDPELSKLKRDMERTPFRVFTLPGAMAQNAEGIYGLEGVGGFHDNELRWYREFRGDQQDRNYFDRILKQDANGNAFLDVSTIRDGNNFLNLANVRYYLGNQGGRIVTLENQGALGRLSLAGKHVVFKEQDIPAALKNGTYDIRTTVALLEEPDRKSGPLPVSDSLQPIPVLSISISWEKYTFNYRKARVKTDHDGFLRISEVYYPGWKVRIDGKSAKVYRADLAWMAVYLPEGDHEIEMMPESLYLAKASAISIPVILVMLCYWAATGAMRFRVKKNGTHGTKSEKSAVS